MNISIKFICFILLLSFIIKPLQANEDIGFRFDSKVKSVKIPIQTQHNLILLPIRINDSFEMNFILDTGVKTTILTEPTITKFLNIEEDCVRSIRVKGFGENEPLQAQIASKINISLPNGVIGTNLHLIVLPENTLSFSELFGKPVFGIIGYDLFKQFVVEINYSQQFIKLHDPKSYKVRRKDQVIPIEVKKSKPYIKAKVVDATGKLVTTQLLLDTGASQAVSLSKHKVALPERTIQTYLGHGLSGDIFGKLGRVDGLQLGGFYFEDVVAGYPQASSLQIGTHHEPWEGNIGGEILQRFQVIFDYANRRIMLRKNAKYKKRFDYNMSGLDITATGQAYSDYEIMHIRPSSSTDNIGLIVGDKILQVNNIPTTELTIEQVYTIINKKPNAKVCLKVKRVSEEIEICFRLKEEI